MANFTKTFMDFSLGEIDQKNLMVSVSGQNGKGCSLLENMRLTDTRGVERRTGTLQIATTKYPVDSENPQVRLHSMFIGRGLSYIGLMYVTDTTDYTSEQIIDLATDSGYGISPVNAKVLCIDWFKSEGFTDTYVNTTVLYIDKDVPLSFEYYGEFPRTLNNSWLDLYSFTFTPFQNFAIVTHNTGTVEPFVLFLTTNDDNDNVMGWFLHRRGLAVTNPNSWSSSDLSNAFAVPYEQANLNPNLALKLERLGDTNIKVTSQWYDNTAEDYDDWSTTNNLGDVVPKPNPFDKRIDYLRVTILANTYILKYTGSEVSTGVYEIVDDMSAYDVHRFSIVVDAPSANDLWTVLATAKTTTDFNLESFNVTDGYPDNAIFYDQRLLFTRDGRVFNSNVGNAFLFNQYRFPQDSINFTYTFFPLIGDPELKSLPLLISYSGEKIASDAFDFNPLTEALVDVSWLNKSQNIEMGTYSEINNISGLEDSLYAFNSIRSLLGAKYGSKKSQSIKASNDTIFIDGSNKSIRNYFYNGQIRTYASSDLNDLNGSIIEHLLNPITKPDDIEILEMSYDQDYETVYLIVGPTYSLISITYDRLAGKACWNRMTLGGVNADTTSIKVYSTSFLRNDKSDSYTYIATERDGVVYLEKFAREYEKEEMNAFNLYGGSVQVENLPYFLDFAKGFVGATSDTWDVGEEYADTVVSVLADGFWISNVSVDSSGELTLDRSVRTLVVGYPYKSKFRTLNLEPQVGGELGGTLHWMKSINYVHLRVNKSYGGELCTTDLNNLEKIPYDADDMIVDDSLKLFTGEIVIAPLQEASSQNSVYIETDAPYPFELLSISIKGEVNER